MLNSLDNYRVPPYPVIEEYLSSYLTSDLVIATRVNKAVGIKVIHKLLEIENTLYRNGQPPEIESKLLALIAYDLTNATDFAGNAVRTKETPEQLEKIIKVSEVMELQIELDRWFNEKSRKKQQERSLLLEQAVEALNSQDNGGNEQLIEELKIWVEEEKQLEFELISEIIDLFYNLLQLMEIDNRNSYLYYLWVIKICNCLGWNVNEAYALTVAKYHHRNFKNAGSNSFDTEYKLIGTIMNSSDNNDESKINFPSNKQLKQLHNLLEEMIKPSENKSIRQQINDSIRGCMRKFNNKPKVPPTGPETVSLRAHYDNLKEEYKRQNKLRRFKKKG